MDHEKIKTEIYETLKSVNDPELGINISDLGLIDKISISGNDVLIYLGTTSPVCPASSMMRSNAKDIVKSKFPDFKVEITAAENFKWSRDRLSKIGKTLLDMNSGTFKVELPKQETVKTKLKPAFERIPFLMAAVLCLLLGLWTGLIRMGWVWPVKNPEWISLHGPLMVCGFLGTVIGLERAVGLDKRWGYLAPILAAIGAGSYFILGAGSIIPMTIITAGSIFYTAIFLTVLIKHRDFPTYIMTLGAFSWVVGNILFLTGFLIYQLVPWWMCFLIITIAGERIELNRFLSPKSGSDYFFMGSIGLMLISSVLALFFPDVGTRLFGVSLVLLTIWLFLYDIARKTVLRDGVTKFIAVCLLTGYCWLGAGGLIAIIIGFKAAGPYYDAYLHTIFLGFVIAMIFGHAPIIFPGILKINIQFNKRFYAHLILLHIGLLIRITADLSLDWDFRLWGALLNAVAILVFFANTVTSIKR